MIGIKWLFLCEFKLIPLEKTWGLSNNYRTCNELINIIIFYEVQYVDYNSTVKCGLMAQ